MLSFLSSPTLTSIHDYWKKHNQYKLSGLKHHAFMVSQICGSDAWTQWKQFCSVFHRLESRCWPELQTSLRLMVLLGILWLLAELRSLKSGNWGSQFLLTVGRRMSSIPVGCPQVLATQSTHSGAANLRKTNRSLSLWSPAGRSQIRRSLTVLSASGIHPHSQGGDYTGRDIQVVGLLGVSENSAHRSLRVDP